MKCEDRSNCLCLKKRIEKGSEKEIVLNSVGVNFVHE